MPSAEGSLTAPSSAPPAATLLDLLTTADPDRTALEAVDRAPLTYGGLTGQVQGAAAWLRDAGLGADDTAAIVLPNGPELAGAFLGAAAAGISAPLNPAYQRQEFAFYLADLEAKLLIVAEGLDSPARDVARERGIRIVELGLPRGGPAGVFTLDGRIPAGSPTVTPRSGDVALVLHTSGTTSRPKMVPLTHGNLIASSAAVAKTLQLSPDDRCLNVMPLFHIHGIAAAVLGSLTARGSVVCTPGFLGPRFFRWMEETEPTWYTAVPTMHQAILARASDAANQAILRNSRLRFVRSSSAALPRRVLEELEGTLGVPAIEAYGMTEAAHQMASNPLPPGVRKPGSVGHSAGAEVAIVDTAGRKLTTGQTGEVVVRGPGVTAGDRNNPEANASGFSSGWLRTGDEGVLDADGYLTLTGRIKEQINRAGEKISPLEVDQALAEHPAVSQALCFGVSHPVLGEDIAAAVVLRLGIIASERQLREYLAGRLAYYKVPRRIVVVDAIPAGPTGKPQRLGLAERLDVTADLPVDDLDLTPPRTPVEEIVAAAWAEVMGEAVPGVRRNFFARGGDSILATRLVARLREQLAVDLTLLTFFDAPTVEGVSNAIEPLLGEQTIAPIRTLPAWFESQVELTPDGLAVTCEGESLTYRELNLRANRLAHHLIALGVVPETLVGLYAEPSLEMVTGILAILKAGGAYVPIDRGYPAERRRFMIEDAGVQLLLTQRHLAGSLGTTGARLVCIEDAGSGEPANPVTGLGPENLAYVIYTSGSTGKPKGVMVTHRNVAGLFRSTAGWFAFGPRDVHTLFHSIAFDFSVWELWGALLHGGRLVVVPFLTSRSPEAFRALLTVERVTVLSQTPSAFGQLIEADARADSALSLRLITFAGEALYPRILAPWISRHGDSSPALVNMYGITETTVHVMYRRITRADLDGGSVIGRPIPDLTVHILDPVGQPVGTGLPGELFIGGPGLSRGYLNRPELTAARFVTMEVPGSGTVPLYRTGDRARMLRDGDIEYLGRLDSQVKIRGHRIELGEIESALAGHPGIAGSAVVVREAAPGDLRLVAYFVPRGAAPGAAELRAHLGRTLPEPMIPSSFVPLDHLPLTQSGKVDRGWLASRPLGAPRRDGTAPATPTEAAVAAVWEEVFGVQRIYREDRFFDLGGHSLVAMRIASRLRQRYHVDVSIRTILEHSAVELLAREVDRLLALRAGGASEPGTSEVASGPPASDTDESADTVPRRADRGRAPATSEQRLLWEIERAAPGTSAYNLPIYRRIEGAVDLDILAAALDDVANQHEAFRTSLEEGSRGLIQRMAPSVSLPMEVLDFRDQPPAAAEDAARSALDSRCRRPFDLTRAPLCRVTVARLADQDALLLLTTHHLICDGWSIGLILDDLRRAYDARAEGRAPANEPMPTDFGDYAAWMATPKQEALRRAHLEYWRGQLDGADLNVDLPTDHPRPTQPTFEGHAERLWLPAALVVQLEDRAREHDTTLNVLLLAAFRILLYRLGGQEDLTIGTVLAGRDMVDVEHMIGYFARTVLLRTRVTDATTLAELVQETRGRVIDALDHPASLEDVVGAVRTPTDWAFRLLFSFNEERKAAERIGAARIITVSNGVPGAKVDLGLALTKRAEALTAVLTTRSDIFEPETTRRFLHIYQTLLEAIASGTGGSVSRFSLFRDGEREQVLSLAPGPRTPAQVTRTIGELFLAQAERGPSRTALIAESGVWTFEMLADRASRLAADLARQGIGRGDIVALVSARSPEMVMAMVAVVLAGAAYLPIEPDQPAGRIRGMLEDARARLVLADDAGERLGEIGVPVQRLDFVSDAGSPARTPPPAASPEDPVYVLFTSGSTGRPKGVVVPHRALMNLLEWALRHFPIGSNDIVLQRTPLGFDVSVLEVWGPLLAGCPMVLARPDRDSDPRYIRDTIRTHGVTLIQMVPSLLTLVLELRGLTGCDTLERVLCAGEPLSTELVHRFHAAHGAELVNLYGPTETTIYATFWHCRPGVPNSPIPIGRPIPNTSAYVLDRSGEPMPIGVPGELYLGGLGVGLGYVNRPDLTGERFVPDPFSSSSGERMYQTGDRARFRADGNLEYLGRVDDQLKLHGIRIEPGEIESLLNARTDVLESAIGVTKVPVGVRLTAWVVPSPGASPAAETLRADLARALPRSLVPSLVVFLDRLPRMASGKIDRRALTAPMVEPVQYEPPRTAMEARVADVWAAILVRERIGRHDDLLALGGHSLVAIRIAHELRSHLRADITLRTILENPTVASLGAELDRLSAASGPAAEKPIPRVPRIARVPRPAGNSPPPAAS